MRVVYEPENLIDAHLVKGVLEQSGIPVYLRGEHLAGGIGELPVFGLFALCVPESCEAEARLVVEALQRNRAMPAQVEDEDGGTGWVEVPV
ncbi:MAG TPA: DUF2007 domain-containing protein [Xanthomonadaceae bacterium]|jgi:hypothetical protein|nr:DUF2007 domain-containing protein [Xanthomonadaceae bacterium]